MHLSTWGEPTCLLSFVCFSFGIQSILKEKEKFPCSPICLSQIMMDLVNGIYMRNTGQRRKYLIDFLRAQKSQVYVMRRMDFFLLLSCLAFESDIFMSREKKERKTIAKRHSGQKIGIACSVTTECSFFSSRKRMMRANDRRSLENHQRNV